MGVLYIMLMFFHFVALKFGFLKIVWSLKFKHSSWDFFGIWRYEKYQFNFTLCLEHPNLKLFHLNKFIRNKAKLNWYFSYRHIPKKIPWAMLKLQTSNYFYCRNFELWTKVVLRKTRPVRVRTITKPLIFLLIRLHEGYKVEKH